MKNVTAAEAALIAGVIRSPISASPFDHPDAALARRNVVLDQMVSAGLLSSDEGAKAKKAPLGVEPGTVDQGEAPYFIDALRGELFRSFDAPKLPSMDLKILSTMDRYLQNAAQSALVEGLEEIGGQTFQEALRSIVSRSRRRSSRWTRRRATSSPSLGREATARASSTGPSRPGVNRGARSSRSSTSPRSRTIRASARRPPSSTSPRRSARADGPGPRRTTATVSRVRSATARHSPARSTSPPPGSERRSDSRTWSRSGRPWGCRAASSPILPSCWARSR